MVAKCQLHILATQIPKASPSFKKRFLQLEIRAFIAQQFVKTLKDRHGQLPPLQSRSPAKEDPWHRTFVQYRRVSSLQPS